MAASMARPELPGAGSGRTIARVWRSLRRLTRFFVVTLAVSAPGLGLFFLLRDALGSDPSGPPWPLSVLAAPSAMGCLAGVAGLVLCGLLEVFDRLPPRRRAILSNFARSGYLHLGRLGKCDLRVHLGLVFLIVVLAALRSRIEHASALLLVVVVHEAGHALLVRRFGGRVYSIDLTPVGGVCRYDDTLTPTQDAAVAWGGVLAQLVLHLLVSAALWTEAGAPQLAPWQGLSLLATINGSLMLLNLIPISPLDGAKAWQLPTLLLRGRGSARGRQSPRRPVGRGHGASHPRVVRAPREDAPGHASKRGETGGKAEK